MVTLNELSRLFFQSLLSGRKTHLIRVRICGTLFGRCGVHPNAHHIIFSICFKFTIPKDQFCDVCSFGFSLLLLKMYFWKFNNVNQQSKEETLICAVWWYKAAIDNDTPKQVLCKNLLSNLAALFLEVKKLKI